MKNICDYRMVIIDEDDKLRLYDIDKYLSHMMCIDEFVKEMGYKFPNPDSIVSRGNCIFYNNLTIQGDKTFLIYLPNKVSDTQLYYLEYIANWLNDVDWLVVKKGTKTDKEYSFKGDVQKQFEEIILSKYYKKVRSR